ncbi:hypothetical protein KHA93_03310 [Bacillus sp. FJAT-49732]|uniref:Uncharacterized protein n=1 Tax=Lederbergia citrisecunda TaxID=2833583 RepID=A0A942YIU8_9BACI|nr:hypothetical protein [Lederbergia citrisecunda]MBS4198678.1 hypothetical protein [Lederbergia citrisecunda]
MLFRGFMLLLGFGFAVSGGVSLIGYLNLVTMGNTFIDYLVFIAKRPECYLLPVGILMITGTIFYNDEKKSNDYD